MDNLETMLYAIRPKTYPEKLGAVVESYMEDLRSRRVSWSHPWARVALHTLSTDKDKVSQRKVASNLARIWQLLGPETRDLLRAYSNSIHGRLEIPYTEAPEQKDWDPVFTLKWGIRDEQEYKRKYNQQLRVEFKQADDQHRLLAKMKSEIHPGDEAKTGITTMGQDFLYMTRLSEKIEHQRNTWTKYLTTLKSLNRQVDPSYWSKKITSTHPGIITPLEYMAAVNSTYRLMLAHYMKCREAFDLFAKKHEGDINFLVDTYVTKAKPLMEAEAIACTELLTVADLISRHTSVTFHAVGSSAMVTTPPDAKTAHAITVGDADAKAASAVKVGDEDQRGPVWSFPKPSFKKKPPRQTAASASYDRAMAKLHSRNYDEGYVNHYAGPWTADQGYNPDELALAIKASLDSAGYTVEDLDAHAAREANALFNDPHEKFACDVEDRLHCFAKGKIYEQDYRTNVAREQMDPTYTCPPFDKAIVEIWDQYEKDQSTRMLVSMIKTAKKDTTPEIAIEDHTVYFFGAGDQRFDADTLAIIFDWRNNRCAPPAPMVDYDMYWGGEEEEDEEEDYNLDE